MMVVASLVRLHGCQTSMPTGQCLTPKPQPLPPKHTQAHMGAYGQASAQPEHRKPESLTMRHNTPLQK